MGSITDSRHSLFKPVLQKAYPNLNITCLNDRIILRAKVIFPYISLQF